MTRSAWVTVRLPGASTAPPTSTRIWLQTGAVKHGRKTVNHDARIVGTVDWAVADSMRSCVIESVESSSPLHARVRIPGQVGQAFRCDVGHRFQSDVGHPLRGLALPDHWAGERSAVSSGARGGDRCQPRECRCDAYVRYYD